MGMSQRVMSLVAMLLLTTAVIGYNNCSGLVALDGNIGTGFQISNGSKALLDFEEKVHPILTQYCGACHGEEISPLFAVEDSLAAYQELETKLDFNNISQSRVVQKLIENHNCWNSCQDDAAELLAALEDWIEGAGGAGPKEDEFKINLAEQMIPAALPLDDTGEFVDMIFPLDAQGFPGASLVLGVQDFKGGAYRFSPPRLVGLTKGAKVKGLVFRINGSVRPNEATYRFVDMEDTELSDRALSATPMVVLLADGAGVDMLTPAFEILEPNDMPVRPTPTFAEVTSGVLASCTGCHSAAGGTLGNYDFSSFDMVMLDPLDEDPPEPAIVPGAPVLSPMFDAVSKQRMPAAAPLAPNQIDMLRDWIMGGAVNN